ncbi:MAG: glycosyltransferase family 39 protein [Candidatus Omnitrophica bacterium]|nr:glycosyltransferase family 39 protein [Candidatus Omnitrophota bacterium]
MLIKTKNTAIFLILIILLGICIRIIPIPELTSGPISVEESKLMAQAVEIWPYLSPKIAINHWRLQLLTFFDDNILSKLEKFKPITAKSYYYLYSQWTSINTGFALLNKAQLNFNNKLYEASLLNLEDFLSNTRQASPRIKALTYIGIASNYAKLADLAEIQDKREVYYDKAISYFLEASKLLADSDELNISICSVMGYTYFKKGNYQSAYHYLNKGLAYPLSNARKEHIDLYISLGFMALELQRCPDAIGYFNRALTLKPNASQRRPCYIGLMHCYQNSLSIFPPDHAPLQYIILYPFLFLGRNEFILRLPALLCGIGCLFMTYRLGMLIFGAGTGLLSLSILSLSMWHIYDSTRADMYTLFTLLNLLAVFFYCKILKKDSSIKTHVLFLLFSVLSVYAFYPNFIIVLAGLLLTVLFYRKLEKKSRLYIIFAIITALSLPGLINACNGMQWLYGQRSFLFPNMGRGRSILPILFSSFGGLMNFLPLNIFIFILGLLFILKKKDMITGLPLLVFLALPCLFLLACSLFHLQSGEQRYFSPIYPFFVIVAAYGIENIKKRTIAVLVFCLFSTSLFLFILHRAGVNAVTPYIPEYYMRRSEGFDSAVNYLKKEYRTADAVAVLAEIEILQYNLDKENRFFIKKVKPLRGNVWYFRYDADTIKNVYGLWVSDTICARLGKLWKTHKRLFLIDSGFIHRLRNKDFSRWIEKNCSQKTAFDSVTIYLFDDEEKKALIDAAICRCNAIVDYLGCEERLYPIIYPFQRIRWRQSHPNKVNLHISGLTSHGVASDNKKGCPL